MSRSGSAARCLTSFISVVLMVVCAQVHVARPACAQSLSIRDLNAEEDNWETWFNERRKLQFTGRYEGRSGSTFRLQQFKLSLRAPSAASIPDRIQPGQPVLVTGSLRRDATGLHVDVERKECSEIPLQELQRRRRQLRDHPAAELLALASEFQVDAEFYGDDMVLREIADIRFSVFDERRRRAAGDPAALWQLAEDANEMGVTPADAQAVRFASLTAESRKAKPNYDQLQQRIAQFCPGWNRESIPPPSAEIKLAFERDADETYRMADQDVREQMLHRLFYRRVHVRYLQQQMPADGKGGIQLATTLRNDLPEESQLAADWAKKEVEGRIRAAGELPRSGLLELSDLLKQYNRENDVMLAVDNWMTRQMERFSGSDLESQLRLTEEYLWAGNLFSRPDFTKRGIAGLKQAWEAADESSAEEAENIAERLQGYGWYRKNDQWLTAEEAAQKSDDQSTQAMREGRVEKGMSPAQVRRTLGNPTRVSRLISGASVREFWIFPTPGAGEVVVQFHRKRTDPPDNAEVTYVSTITR
ncbi:MAG: hypothetical protein KDA85_06560 [Planctomycetaceae bacterium]|nr:hypothetical protein [Planctomycetaceae bacterium]